MKKIFFTLIVLIAAYGAKAQVGFNYAQYDIGFGGGMNSGNTDFTKSSHKYSGHINFTYNFSPYINYVIEYQAGNLAGDSLKFVPYAKYVDNYTALTFKCQVQLGELIDYSGSEFKNAVKNFYLGAGVGVCYSDAQAGTRDTLYAEAKASNIMIPLKVGYEFKVFNDYNEPWMKVDLGYEYNYVFSDKLDAVLGGKSRDAFSRFAISFKFALGGTTSYRKQINY